MNIKLKNKFLYFDEYKIKCAVGKRGITNKKIEGDYKTPSGFFMFKSIFYRNDRVPEIRSALKKRVIKKNMGWCDDPISKYYNKLIKFPFNFRAEKLWLRANIYDVIVIIDYNTGPIIKKRGSAIFLHIAKKNYPSTKGCIAVSKKDIMLLISVIDHKTKLIID